VFSSHSQRLKLRVIHSSQTSKNHEKRAAFFLHLSCGQVNLPLPMTQEETEILHKEEGNVPKRK